MRKSGNFLLLPALTKIKTDNFYHQNPYIANREVQDKRRDGEAYVKHGLYMLIANDDWV